MKILSIGEGEPLHWAGQTVTAIGPQALTREHLLEAQAILLNPSPDGQALFGQIRKDPDPQVYLKPVFFLDGGDFPLTEELRAAADGCASPTAAEALWHHEWRTLSERILAELARIPRHEGAKDANPGFKALRWMLTRRRDLTPMATATNAQGFIYPAVEAFADKADATMTEALNFLEEQGVLASDFVDRIYRCAGCGSAFLNVREACSQCQSTRLESDDLIHHFRCGYVAPLQDFMRQGSLTCPKCDRGLSMIGVDYDKPSAVSHCLSCGHVSQDTDTLSTCYQCGRSMAPEEQKVSIIKRFHSNGLSQSAALFGLESLFRKIVESELEVLPLPVFKRVVQLEINRISRYQRSESALLLLELKNIEQVYLEKPARANQIFAEIVAILKAILRSTDVVTTLNDSVFVVLLVETPEEGAARAVERINERLATLLDSNLSPGVQVNIHRAQIQTQDDAGTLINQLLGRLA